MPLPITVTYEFTDGLGDTTTMVTYYDQSVVDTLAKANTITLKGSELLNVISDAQVTNAWVKFNCSIDGGGTPAGRNDAGATFSFENDQPYNSYSCFIPAIKQSLLINVGNSKIVDSNGTGVGNFISFMETGGGVTGGYSPTDRFLHDLVNFTGGKQTVKATKNV